MALIRRCFCESEQDLKGLLSMENLRLFSYREIRAATNNFSQCNKLGRGGFGTVYKAWVLYQEGSLLDMVDANIKDYPEEEVLRFILVGLACTQATPSSRPTMRQVVAMLSRPVPLHELEMRPPSSAHSTVSTPPRAGPLFHTSSKARWPPAAAVSSSSFRFSEVAPR
ncbi:hypothetical protein EJB05_51465 [Eragrostis curvula]|uniref:Serine-threonine/tyrosine-protein kinase catalytic domain-containing protein n=1 Tax=Eragrostis curvula TaxID=38414 RepID=A0A5J9SVF7_9POAL|nr:hypothetical protein EJB05_51465 [Eragrostis curvula]